jgi:arginase
VEAAGDPLRRPAGKQSEVVLGRAFGGRQIELTGVRFDGMGRTGGQARAPSALRAAGLHAAVGKNATMGADVLVSEPRPERAATSGLLNETALLEMVTAVRARVKASLAAARFPLVYGGDCAVLLAAVPALRAVAGAAGLVFIDGHEDATTMEASLSGEAANMEVALLLGLTGGRAPRAVRAQVPALSADDLAMLGPRDDAYRRELGVPTLAGRVWLRTPGEVAPDPAGTALAAVAHVASGAPGWWLHTDLDVLARSEFAACGAPGEVSLPGGLTWQQLTDVCSAAVRAEGCRGWSIAIYNPDLDPGGRAAARIVEFVADVARH